MSEKTVFEKLNGINVNDKVEIKDTGKVKLSYLSWAFAWAEAKKLYPNLEVKVHEDDRGLPYFSSNMGIMVKTDVTIENITHTVYLPVMDGANNAMKEEPYEIITKYGSKSVKAADMMDVNKTIQRAIVKGLALHGLGLYIYAGEDLPEQENDKPSPVKQASESKNKANTEAPKENPPSSTGTQVNSSEKAANSFRRIKKDAPIQQVQEPEL